MMATILAVAEQKDGALKRVSEEVVTAARSVADPLDADVEVVVVGPPGIGEASKSLGTFGAERVVALEHDELGSYNADGYADALAAHVGAGDYFAVLFPATSTGKDLAPRVAAKLDVPLASEATALEVEDGELVVTRPVYAGKAFVELTLDAEPRVVSLRQNVFRPAEDPRDADVETVTPSVDPGSWRVRVREVKAAGGDQLDVSEAPIVVSGGRGLKGPENWNLLEDLADALGDRVALGASRAVVDAGWRPHAEQVGQTGKTVAPQLYVAVAISGAIQHLAGMRTASTIVAINKDPDAPIFKVADYGIVGDAFEVVPRLTEEVRKARA
ncbi:MAG TPA: electron transfer flavoprotein subunit alpha/FixB family protein [Longimicrobiales bacterium]|nr:electron transfer flavoprotein subunit alpha/FixB family protein [Longimicrobiales bacterium]